MKILNEKISKILILTGDPVGPKMAGPGIRALNFARELARKHQVILATTNTCDLANSEFEIKHISSTKDFLRLETWSEIIVIQGNIVLEFPQLLKSKKYIVCDIYDPMHLEQLEQGRDRDINLWNRRIAHANHILALQIKIGDFFLASSERQRDFWLGSLALAGRVNAKTYSRDNTLYDLIAVVPFGHPDEFPVKQKEVLKGVLPGINKNDIVMIWAGGIYNWFDPITLIKSMKLVCERNPTIKLFFMGTKHPHPGVPEMEVLNRSYKLATDLQLLGQNVFFNQKWVAYEDRANYLLEADIGVSTHFEHLETKFSFRTRILDYLWAGLPIITTNGDVFADLVTSHRLGIAVPELDESALAEAILKIAENHRQRNEFANNVRQEFSRFTWLIACEPLIQFADSPRFAADHISISPQGIETKIKLPPERGIFLQFRRLVYNVSVRYQSEGLGGVVKQIRNKLSNLSL